MFKTVNYIEISDISSMGNNDTKEDVKQWYKDNEHHNGYATFWTVIDPNGVGNNEPAYPHIEQFFLDNGFKVGNRILVHSKW